MASRVPGIACIAIIGKQNNPLLISLFPPDRDALEYHFLLSSALDIFDARAPTQTADQDFGLLQAVDERIAMYGWLANTGVKFVVVLDMAARAAPRDAKPGAALGVKDADLKPAFRALQMAYINMLRNPFYTPDEPLAPGSGQKLRSAHITSPALLKEVRRIAENWAPGVTSL